MPRRWTVRALRNAALTLLNDTGNVGEDFAHLEARYRKISDIIDACHTIFLKSHGQMSWAGSTSSTISLSAD